MTNRIQDPRAIGVQDSWVIGEMFRNYNELNGW
jgi:hypothetical protein